MQGLIRAAGMTSTMGRDEAWIDSCSRKRHAGTRCSQWRIVTAYGLPDERPAMLCRKLLDGRSQGVEAVGVVGTMTPSCPHPFLQQRVFRRTVGFGAMCTWGNGLCVSVRAIEFHRAGCLSAIETGLSCCSPAAARDRSPSWR